MGQDTEQEETLTLLEVYDIERKLPNFFFVFERSLTTLFSAGKMTEATYRFYLSHINKILRTLEERANSEKCILLFSAFLKEWKEKLVNEGRGELGLHLFTKKAREETENEKYISTYFNYAYQLLILWNKIIEVNHDINIFREQALCAINSSHPKVQQHTDDAHTQQIKIEKELNKLFETNPFLSNDFILLKMQIKKLETFYSWIILQDKEEGINYLNNILPQAIIQTCSEFLKEKNQFCRQLTEDFFLNTRELTKNKLILLRKSYNTYLAKVTLSEKKYFEHLQIQFDKIINFICQFNFLDDDPNTPYKAFQDELQRLQEKLKQIINDDDQETEASKQIQIKAYRDQIKIIFDYILREKLACLFIRLKDIVSLQNKNQPSTYYFCSQKASEAEASLQDILSDVELTEQNVSKDHQAILSKLNAKLNALSDLNHIHRENDLQCLDEEIISIQSNIKQQNKPSDESNFALIKLGFELIRLKNVVLNKQQSLMMIRQRESIPTSPKIETIHLFNQQRNSLRKAQHKIQKLPETLVASAHAEIMRTENLLSIIASKLTEFCEITSHTNQIHFKHLITSNFNSSYEFFCQQVQGGGLIKTDVPNLLNNKLANFDQEINAIERIDRQNIIPIKLLFHCYKTYQSTISNDATLAEAFAKFSALYFSLKQHYASSIEKINDCSLDEIKKRRIDAEKNIAPQLALLKNNMEHFLKRVKQHHDEDERQEQKKQEINDLLTYERLKKIPLADIGDISIDEKIIFLKQECMIYAKHLRHAFYDPKAHHKRAHIIKLNQILEKPNANLTANKERLCEFKAAFAKVKPLLEQSRDSHILRFLKKVTCVLAPSLKERLQQVKGQLFSQTISPLLETVSAGENKNDFCKS